MVIVLVDGMREGFFKCGIFFCKKCQGNKEKIKKYYFYSIRLLMKKTDKYLNNIKVADNAIKKNIFKFKNNFNITFYNFLFEKFK